MENMPELESAKLVRESPGRAPEHLTPRQLDVLALLCEGLPNKVIGRRLNISSATVKIHVARILRVLHVSSRLQAVIAARSFWPADGAPPADPVSQESAPAPHAAAALRLVWGERDAAPLLAANPERQLAASLA